MHNQPFYDLRLQMTNACLLKCRHCFASSGTPSASELGIVEMRTLIREHLVPRGLKLLVMTGGEPLLRFEDCLKLTKLCKQLGVFCRVNTGGFVENVKDKVRMLVEAGIDVVLLPLQSTISKVHDDFCGVDGVFDNTTSIFKLLSDLGATSYMRITLFKWNVQEIPKLVNLARDIGVTKILIRPELPSGRAREQEEYPTITQILDVGRFLVQEQSTSQDVQIQLLNPFFQFLYSSKPDDYAACTCGITKAFVSAEGYLKPCGFYKDEFGNIRENAFDELWEKNPHPLFQQLRLSKPFMECLGCKHWPLCRGGCPVVIYNDWESLDGQCRYCPLQNRIKWSPQTSETPLV
jgi:radical SAM protein with 4Fe4S-binding SPASM domain